LPLIALLVVFHDIRPLLLDLFLKLRRISMETQPLYRLSF